MKNWQLYTIFSLLGVILIMMIIILCSKPSTPVYPDYSKLNTTIQTLSNNIDSMKNEQKYLKESIIKSKTRVIVLNKEYEKKLIDITNQPILSDCQFFSNYLSKNIQRFPNSNNSTTTKTN